jgi:hypothetical protein
MAGTTRYPKDREALRRAKATSMSPLALSGHANGAEQTPLSRVKRAGMSRSNRERAWSQPTAHAGLIAEIDVAELALEISFLAGDHAVTDDEIEGHQRHDDP